MQSSHQKVFKKFFKQDPISVCGNSFYLNDYKSFQSQNWLRSQSINALNLIHKKQHQSKIKDLVKNKANLFQEINDSSKYISYVRIIDSFLVTMILFTKEIQILQSIEGQNIFDKNTKYILFPMNTQINSAGGGSHWFLLMFVNPLYQTDTIQMPKSYSLFVFDSISTSKNTFVVNQIKEKLALLLNIFHKINDIQIEIKYIKKLPKQQNNFDCGIFTLAFIDFILQKSLEDIQSKLNFMEPKQINEHIEVILKSSPYLRKFYRQQLQRQILFSLQK